MRVGGPLDSKFIATSAWSRDRTPSASGMRLHVQLITGATRAGRLSGRQMTRSSWRGQDIVKWAYGAWTARKNCILFRDSTVGSARSQLRSTSRLLGDGTVGPGRWPSVLSPYYRRARRHSASLQRTDWYVCTALVLEATARAREHLFPGRRSVTISTLRAH